VAIRTKLREAWAGAQCEVVWVTKPRAAGTKLFEQALWPCGCKLRVPLVMLLVELVAVEVAGLEAEVVAVAEERLP
jgi:hypothetical protein